MDGRETNTSKVFATLLNDISTFLKATNEKALQFSVVVCFCFCFVLMAHYFSL